MLVEYCSYFDDKIRRFCIRLGQVFLFFFLFDLFNFYFLLRFSFQTNHLIALILIRFFSFSIEFFTEKKRLYKKKKFFARAYYKHTLFGWFFFFFFACDVVVFERLILSIFMNIYALTHLNGNTHAHTYTSISMHTYTRKIHALLAHCGSVLLLPVWLHFCIKENFPAICIVKWMPLWSFQKSTEKKILQNKNFNEKILIFNVNHQWTG